MPGVVTGETQSNKRGQALLILNNRGVPMANPNLVEADKGQGERQNGESKGTNEDVGQG